MDLTDEQWTVVEPLLPKPVKRADGKGRPRVDNRAILNYILWVMLTGTPWHDMPNRYPPYQTCHRRFQEWVKAGTFETILRKLVQDVKERGDLDLTECFINGTFVMAKKGLRGGKTKRGKGTKLMAVADGAGFPIALSVGSASPHEVKLEVISKIVSDKNHDTSKVNESEVILKKTLITNQTYGDSFSAKHTSVPPSIVFDSVVTHDHLGLWLLAV